MLSVNTKFYRHTSSKGIRTILTYYASGKIKNKKIYLNQNEVANNAFLSDGQPFKADIRDVGAGNYNMAVNVYIDSPAGLLYCKLNRLERIILKYQFKRTWIQQTENIKWLIMAVFAGIGAFLGVVKFLLDCK